MAKGGQDADYTQEERDSFGIWVELGARDPEQQWIVAGSLSVRWERREPSGSPWVQELLLDPLPVLRREKVPGVHERSRITTTILHHHRGLKKKIIVTTATVEQQTGDVSLVLDKETPGSY
jgi:hypothetical protein